MTKFLLNSGGIKNNSAAKRRFHIAMIEGVEVAPKILLCNFAQGREYWEAKFQGYCDSILQDVIEVAKPEFRLAMPEEFVEQCKWADIIYFHGGDDHLITYWMKQFNLAEIFNNKTVATNSASSNMLSTHYWTCDWRMNMDGLAILPIKFISHFKSDFSKGDPRGPIDWDQARLDLEAFGDPDLAIYALREGEFVVIDQ